MYSVCVPAAPGQYCAETFQSYAASHIYIYLYYTQPLHDRVLAEFFPMYEGEFTVFRAGFLAIQFKTKMHKIGTRIAFLLEEKEVEGAADGEAKGALLRMHEREWAS